MLRLPADYSTGADALMASDAAPSTPPASGAADGAASPSSAAGTSGNAPAAGRPFFGMPPPANELPPCVVAVLEEHAKRQAMAALLGAGTPSALPAHGAAARVVCAPV